MKKILVFILIFVIVMGQFACSCNDKEAETITISLNRSSIVLQPGVGEQLFVTSSNPALETTWSSSDDKIVTVSEQGFVKGVGIGEAVVTAKVLDVEKSCFIKVTGEQYTPVLENVQESVSLFVGKEFTVFPKMTYGGAVIENSVFTWKSDNTSVATVENGKIFGVSVGNAVITVSAEKDGEKIEKFISVTVLDSKILYIEQDNVKLAKNVFNANEVSEITLTAIAIDGTTKISTENVEWESENENIVTVDQTGKVTAVDKGVANVVAKLTVNGKVIKAWTPVEVYKSVISVAEEISGIEIQSDNSMSVSLTSLGYSGTNGEKTVLTVDGKTFVGEISGGNAVFNTDGTLYGRKNVLIEVSDRVYSAVAVITAKLTDYSVNNYFYNVQTKTYEKQGTTENNQVRYGTNLTDYFMVNDSRLLNSEKTGNLVLNVDGSSVFNLYYDQAIPISNSGNNAFLYYLSESDVLGSEKVNIENVGSYKGKSGVYKITNVARRTYIKIVGIDTQYLSEHGLTKFKFNLYFSASSVNVVSSLANDVFTSGKLFSYHMASEISEQSDWIKLYNASNDLVDKVSDAQWTTVEFDLTKAVSESNGIKSISLIIGCEANSSFYIQDARLTA